MAAPIQSFSFEIEAYIGPGGKQGSSAQRAPWRKAAEKPAIADDLVGFAEVSDRWFFERHRRYVHWILRDPVNGVVRGLRNLLPDKLDKAFYLVEGVCWILSCLVNRFLGRRGEASSSASNNGSSAFVINSKACEYSWICTVFWSFPSYGNQFRVGLIEIFRLAKMVMRPMVSKLASQERGCNRKLSISWRREPESQKSLSHWAR